MVDRALSEYASADVDDGRLAGSHPVERPIGGDDEAGIRGIRPLDDGDRIYRIGVCPHLHLAGERGRRMLGSASRPAELPPGELGEVQRAPEFFAASIDARRAVLGEDHPQVVYALSNLGLALVNSDNVVEGTRRLRTAFLAAESTLGPKHPHIALLAVNLGYGHEALRQYRDAATYFERGLALQTELLGPDSPDLLYVLRAMGFLALEQRRCDEGTESFTRALRVIGATPETDNPAALLVLAGLGSAALCRGDVDVARTHLERALALGERAHGPEDLNIIDVLDYLVDMYLRTGDLDQALLQAQRGLAIRRAKLPANSTRLGESYRRIAEVHRRAHRFNEAATALQLAQALHDARPVIESVESARIRLLLGDLTLERGAAARGHYERAVAIYAPIVDPDAFELSMARYGLARAMSAQAGSVTPEARALAEQSLTILQGMGTAFAPEQRAVRAWLARPK